ncbi:MAG: class I adenylate-forming enzyme family protein [Acidimicrobiia bacterium]
MSTLTGHTWPQQLAKRDPDAVAVVTGDGRYTTTDLFRRAAGAADWLDTVGAEKGHPVALLGWASLDSFALLIGGPLAGRPIACLGPQLTVNELVPCFDGLGATVIVADAEVLDTAHAVAALTGCRVVTLPAFEPSSRELDFEPAAESIAMILHTSGTTGKPKRVPLSQESVARQADVKSLALEMDSTTVLANAKGIHHIGGLTISLTALASNGAVIPMRRFSPQAWHDVMHLGATHAATVPSMIEMLVSGGGSWFVPSLRILQYGGAAIHPDTLRGLLRDFPSLGLVGLYGQTEGTPLCVFSPADHRRAFAGEAHLFETAGRPAPGAEIRIDQPDAHGLGEVIGRGPHIAMPGPDGWVRTGDMGRFDAEGFLRLSGRKGDMILRGGENVFPLEVERVLASHPDVREASVVGIPDRRLGQRIVAWVVPVVVDAVPDEGVLRSYCRERLAGFKVPERFVFTDKLPRNPNGKVMRSVLVERASANSS